MCLLLAYYFRTKKKKIIKLKISFIIFLFRTIVTAVNAYTQNVTIFSYGLGGLIVGGIARISFGVKGFVVGSTLGKYFK